MSEPASKSAELFEIMKNNLLVGKRVLALAQGKMFHVKRSDDGKFVCEEVSE